VNAVHWPNEKLPKFAALKQRLPGYSMEGNRVRAEFINNIALGGVQERFNRDHQWGDDIQYFKIDQFVPNE